MNDEAPIGKLHKSNHVDDLGGDEICRSIDYPDDDDEDSAYFSSYGHFEIHSEMISKFIAIVVIIAVFYFCRIWSIITRPIRSLQAVFSKPT